MAAWEIERLSGTVRAFHAREIESAPTRMVWVFEPESTALALGSTQSMDDVDMVVAKRLDVDVVRRHSGGGAVLIEPGACLWIDVVIPTDDILWTADVSAAPVWLGRVWAAAIRRAGREGAVVHIGPMQVTPRSSVVCFDGIGPGEVLLDSKTVGISQRRTRDYARFQTIAMVNWNWDIHDKLLAPGLERAGGEVTPVEVSALVGVDVGVLLEAFLVELDQA